MDSRGRNFSPHPSPQRFGPRFIHVLLPGQKQTNTSPSARTSIGP